MTRRRGRRSTRAPAGSPTTRNVSHGAAMRTPAWAGEAPKPRMANVGSANSVTSAPRIQTVLAPHSRWKPMRRHGPPRCPGFTVHPLTLTTKTPMVDYTQEPCNRLQDLGGYMKGTYNIPAPGQLETVRKLMNTFLVSSATQIAEDRLPALLRDQKAWRREFPDVRVGADDTAELLIELRDDLRRMVGGGSGWPESLQRWLERL